MRKHSFPWAARLVAAALLVSVATPPARAQFATMDIPHIGVQLAEFAKKANDWVETLKNYEVVKDAYAAAQTANNISNDIKGVTDQVRSLTSEGLALQQQIQNDLKQVGNIRNLRVSNMSDLKNLALNLSNLNFASALPSLGQSQRFTQALASGTDADAEVVKEALTVVSTKAGITRTARDMREQQTTAVMSQLALENKAQQDKITQAFQYKKLADELTASAVELQSSTNTANAMSMTDGERVAAQGRAADMLLKAQELREKASTLIASAAQKGPTQMAAEKALMDQMQVAGLTAMHAADHADEDPAY
jgi:hypothetical protein